MLSARQSGPIAIGLVEKLDSRLFEIGSFESAAIISRQYNGEGLKDPSKQMAVTDTSDGEAKQEQCPLSEGTSNEQNVVQKVVFRVLSTEPTASSQSTSAGFSWAPAQVTCNVEQELDAEVTYELQYQQLSGLPESSQVATTDAEKQIKDGSWLKAYEGQGAQCEVSKLLPGRWYAARVYARIHPSVQEGQELLVEAEPSKPAIFRTLPCPPTSPPPPLLVSKERKALKLKWSNPEETGGDGDLTFTLHMKPAPAEAEAAVGPDGFTEVYVGVEKAFKVQKLTPGVKYTFRVKARNTIGESPFSVSSVFSTQATVPSQPQPPEPVGCTPTSITLRWNPPADNGSPVTAYVLERDDGQGGDFQLVYAGPRNSAQAHQLRSGLQYRFRVRADNDEGKSTWSAPTVATTAACPPASPSYVAVVGANRTSATLSWQAPAEHGGAPVTHYEVQLQAKTRPAVEHMGTEWLKIFEGGAMACTINSLRAGCSYRARVRACNSAGWGQYCIPVDINTAPDVPDVPTPPVASSVTSRSILLTWQAPRHDGGAKVLSYKLELSDHTCGCGKCTSAPPNEPLSCSSNAVQLTISDDSCSAEAGGLDPGKIYFFRIQAINSQGSGLWSGWSPITTLAEVPLQPAAPLVTASTSNSVSLKWSPPRSQGAAITHYLVEVAQLGYQHSQGAFDPVLLMDGQAGPDFKCIYKGPACEVDARGLKPSTRYAFRVAAVNVVGPSAFSDPNEVLTGPAPPAAPGRVTAHPISSSELEVAWEEPSVDNGAVVTCYLAEMLVQSGRNSRAANTSSWQQCYCGPASSCRVSGLLPGRSHSFRVKASNCCGYSLYTATATASTFPAPPSEPTKLSVSQRTSNSARAKWEIPDDDFGAPILAFQLEVSSNGYDGWQCVYNGKDVQYKLFNLQPGTKYWLRVAAINSAGCGAYSNVEAFVTMLSPPGPPCNVAVLDATAPTAAEAAVLVTWQPPQPSASSAPAMSYEVTAVPHGDSSLNTVKQVVGPSLTECRLERLSTGTQYAVRMRSVGADATGHSNWSPDVTVVTAGQRKADPDTLSVSSEASAMSLQSARRANQAGKRAVKRPTGASTPTERFEDTVSVSQAARKAGASASDKGKVLGVTTTAAAKRPPTRKNLWQQHKGLIYKILIVAIIVMILKVLFL